eukprot:CAMPEP_0173433444 /NCGR_PEP_ID=MMETSP1357-20121228/10893_1 /TAXON_ID=77926 /ORGANISM="Hemiselmis rufescens, Strain PCC563" /LENGTH=169 /DNA_ID=CAMNT_0014398151 /DNA_START=1 /DNA_END=510 /DNA_ORIENTATION=+
MAPPVGLLPNNASMFQMGGMPGGDFGDGVPIGPPRMMDGSMLPPDVAMQVQTGMPIGQSIVVQKQMPMSRSFVIQKPMYQDVMPQPFVPRMQRSMTMIIPQQETDPVVQVILPSGETKMMPKSQALILQQQLQGGNRIFSSPQQQPQQVQYVQQEQEPAIPWGQDIGDM